MKTTLRLVSPHMHGPIVKDCQYLLAHNRFGDFKPGKPDGDYGEATAASTRRAKYALGYAQPDRKFGPKLYAYLHGEAKLSSLMRARRKRRLAALAKVDTVKDRALKVALGEAAKRITESPAGSNNSPYGRWYGANYLPWCAMFVSYCFSKAGDRKGRRSALAYWFEYEARVHAHGLSITTSPEPGDIVVYHHRQGHVGIFRRWISPGHFETVEGNTSAGASQDNGGAVLIRQRYTSWAPTVFVRVGE